MSCISDTSFRGIITLRASILSLLLNVDLKVSLLKKKNCYLLYLIKLECGLCDWSM